MCVCVCVCVCARARGRAGSPLVCVSVSGSRVIEEIPMASRWEAANLVVHGDRSERSVAGRLLCGLANAISVASAGRGCRRRA